MSAAPACSAPSTPGGSPSMDGDPQARRKSAAARCFARGARRAVAEAAPRPVDLPLDIMFTRTRRSSSLNKGRAW